MFCIFLVIKREHLGGIIYFVSYLLYFGADVFEAVKSMVENGTTPGDLANVFASALGIILSLVVMISLLSDHLKAPDDKKTEWFYQNKDLDRKLDDREDKNHYRLN